MIDTYNNVYETNTLAPWISYHCLNNINGLNTHFVDGAGHWVQQEKPEQVNKIMIDFLKKNKKQIE